MKIKLLAVGTKMPTWVTQGYNEYARRMPSDMQLQLHEIGLGFRGKGADLQRAIAKEGEQMLASIPAQDQVIALHVRRRHTHKHTHQRKVPFNHFTLTS